MVLNYLTMQDWLEIGGKMTVLSRIGVPKLIWIIQGQWILVIF